MATFKNGQMGLLSGAVGPMVYYVYHGRQCVRMRAAARNPRTERQQAGRRAFGMVAHLAGRMRYGIQVGLEGEAQRRGASVQSLFVGMNRHLVEVTEEGTTLDYSLLQLSTGQLSAPLFGTVERRQEEDGTWLTVAFRRAEEGWSGHFVHLYAYAPALEQGVMTAPASMGSGVATVRIPRTMEQEELHLYAFSRDYKGQASATVYLGRVTGVQDEVEGEQVGVTDSSTTAERRSPSPDSGEELSMIPATTEEEVDMEGVTDSSTTAERRSPSPDSGEELRMMAASLNTPPCPPQGGRVTLPSSPLEGGRGVKRDSLLRCDTVTE